MSVNTAITLNRIFSNPAWKLLIVAGLLAFIACFIIKGKKEQYRSLFVSDDVWDARPDRRKTD